MSTESRAPHKSPTYPSPLTYVKIAAILGAITALEVAVFYMHSLRGVILPIFLVLSATKFALVAMFYMRLRFDNRLFSGLFFGGMLLASAVIVRLMALFGIFVQKSGA